MLIGLVEIPKGSNYKYELDKSSGHLILDRVLVQHYPANYGFIPKTLNDDGDELDVFIYSEAPINPLAKVKLEILGVIEVEDNGINDEKLVCNISESKAFYGSSFDQITYFLRNYKSGVIIRSIGDVEKANEVLARAQARYLEQKGNK